MLLKYVLQIVIKIIPLIWFSGKSFIDNVISHADEMSTKLMNAKFTKNIKRMWELLGSNFIGDLKKRTLVYLQIALQTELRFYSYSKFGNSSSSESSCSSSRSSKPGLAPDVFRPANIFSMLLNPSPAPLPPSSEIGKRKAIENHVFFFFWWNSSGSGFSNSFIYCAV